MNYEIELDFFCEILKKCHINTSVLSPLDSLGATLSPGLDNVVGYFFKSDATVKNVLGNIENKTRYTFSTDIKFSYVCLRLPVLSEKNILFIGPYVSSLPSSEDILEICENAGLSPQGQRILREYYASLPVVVENDRIFAVIDAFCERIWQTTSFAVEKFKSNRPALLSPIDNAPHAESAEEILAKAEMMEMRYSFENELIRAVTLGQQHKEGVLATIFSDHIFEKRVHDPVRNAKNYCIIMNTLLRKAAEEGGVHPINIDKLSSKFAAKIEQVSDVKKVSDLMREIFSSYCRMVHKHSVKRYSPIVKRAVLIIESDISVELSLGILSKKLGVSAGYLATVFKKETGKTVTEYVRDKRIEHAKYLLGATNLQIQTVALYCGIMDVQYFSKIFKKQVGKTPKAYRDAGRT